MGPNHRHHSVAPMGSYGQGGSQFWALHLQNFRGTDFNCWRHMASFYHYRLQAWMLLEVESRFYQSYRASFAAYGYWWMFTLVWSANDRCAVPHYLPDGVEAHWRNTSQLKLAHFCNHQKPFGPWFWVLYWLNSIQSKFHYSCHLQNKINVQNLVFVLLRISKCYIQILEIASYGI